MKELQYKAFSLRTHKKNWQAGSPNTCQFELTFRCGLHCKHCYCDCYNKEEYIKKELTTSQVKLIIDKVHNAGVIWLCFTGGDPLARQDFLELYSYAKDKGFLITIFTNAYSMTRTTADYLKKHPPFVVEITVNGANKETYENISGVKGSYDKAVDGLKMITKRKLPLKIKTQLTRDNLKEQPAIKGFIESLGQTFRPSTFLHARLDGNTAPCSLRIPLKESLSLTEKNHIPIDDCQVLPQAADRSPRRHLFNCAIAGGDGIHIDPYGNIIPCICIREPKISLLEQDVKKAQEKIVHWSRSKDFTEKSECRDCSLKNQCYNCPGKALLEKKDMEGAVKWFCDLAHITAGSPILQ